MTRFALLLTLCAALPVSAHAQTEDRGRLHFQAGASYYEAGDYQDALREFQRAYELSQKPELFYNLSLCHQQLGDLDQASSFLERYLTEVEDVPNRANLERRLENFREREQQQEQQEQQQVQQQVQQTEPGSSGGISPMAWAGFGIGGAGLITVAVSGGLALSEKNALEGRDCPDSGMDCDSGSLKTRSIVADIGLGLAVVGVTLGIVGLFVGGNDDDDAQARVRVDPYAGRESAGAVVRGTF